MPEKTPVKLFPFRDDQHEEALDAWIGDPEITRFMASGRDPRGHPSYQWTGGENSWVFAVHHGLAYVGIVGLYAVDFLSQKAELRILIGQTRGAGIGTEAVRLLLNFGFGMLNLHRIYLGTAEENKAAYRAFEKNGFRPEGLLIEDLYRDGHWYNNVRMAVLRRDWEATRA